MRIRPTARLLVIDQQQRILLFQIHDRRPFHAAYPDMTVYWITPGGGVEPHESFEQAAQRELWEETGIQIEAVGSWVWRYERVLHGESGSVRLQERFFMISVSTSLVSQTNMFADEHETHRAYHWWTRSELLQSQEAFVPPTLPQALQPLLDGDIPAEPIDLPM